MTSPIVSVLIPVLGRPDRVVPLLESLMDEPRATPVFLVSPDDDAEIDAIENAASVTVVAYGDEPEVCELTTPNIIVAIVEWDPGPGDYAKKINLGYQLTKTPWLLLGADDLCFHPGWLDAAIKVSEDTGCGVISTNDLGNPAVIAGRHATHPLVARWYVEECGASADGPGIVYHEGYDHQFCDTELTAVARARGCFAAAPESIVEHLHPFWGKGVKDATYEKGMRAGAADQILFNQRRRMWSL